MASIDRPETYEETVADIEEHFGLLPGFLDGIPEQELVNEWPNMKRFMFGETEIPPKYRELIGLAVAANLSCPYCTHFHKGAAKLHGATDAELQETAFLASYTARYSAMIHGQDYDEETFEEEVEQIAQHLKQHAAASDD